MAMASNLLAMASSLIVMASNLTIEYYRVRKQTLSPAPPGSE